MGIQVVELDGEYLEFTMRVSVSTGNDRELPDYEAESIVDEAYVHHSAPDKLGRDTVVTTGQIKEYVESMGYTVHVSEWASAEDYSDVLARDAIEIERERQPWVLEMELETCKNYGLVVEHSDDQDILRVRVALALRRAGLKKD